MDKNRAAFLREDAKTVNVQFQNSAKTFTYLTTLALAEGERVVVPTLLANFHTLAVAQVVEVHDSVQIERDSPILYKWVITKIDETYYNHLLAQNSILQSDFLEHTE